MSKLFVPPSAQRGPAVLKPVWEADLDDHPIIRVVWNPAGTLVAAVTGDGPTFVFDLAGKLQYQLPAHGMGTLACAWHPLEPIIATAGQDGKVRFWDALTGAAGAVLPAGPGWVEQITWSPAVQDHSVLASCAGKQLMFWDSQGQLVRRIQAHSSTVADIAWMPRLGRVRPLEQGGQPQRSTPILASAGYGGVALWQPDADEPMGRYEWKGSTLVVCWSPNGDYLATGDQDATIHFWFTNSGKDLQMWGYPTKVRELAWDHTSRYLATGGGSSVTVWDCSGAKGPENTRPLQLDLHQGQISALAFQRQGPTLVSGCSDGLVAFWRVGQGKRATAKVGLGAAVSALAWARDDKHVAIGTEQGELVVVANPRSS